MPHSGALSINPHGLGGESLDAARFDYINDPDTIMRAGEVYDRVYADPVKLERFMRAFVSPGHLFDALHMVPRDVRSGNMIDDVRIVQATAGMVVRTEVMNLGI